MRVKRMKSESYLAKLLYLGIPAISLFLIDGSVSDPVNTPKLFLLGIVASASVAALVVLGPISVFLHNWVIAVLILFFMIFSVITLFTSNSPLTQSLYGVYGRNNGFLTYMFLAMIFVAASSLSRPEHHRRLILGLLFAGFINVVYCGWVIVFGDFLSWQNPYGNILGTLGNPNFIGSFLGMCFGVLATFFFDSKLQKRSRIVIGLLAPCFLIVMYFSRAIQGRVLAALGISIAVFFWIRFSGKNKYVLLAYSTAVLLVGSLALAGAFQMGPFTQFIYKTSVSLRGQYWMSGWNTGLANPWNGAGFDSLGDWYRRMREARALELPGVDTVVNTAHNVPLDIFAFGGWPMFISYILLFGFVGVISLRFIVKMKNYDPIFISLFVAWLGYQIQSLISINQIGLAVWGWALSGSLVGYIKLSDKNESAEKKLSPQAKNKQEVFSPQLVSGVAMIFGSLIAVPPLAADMNWMSAQKSGNAQKLEESMRPSYMNPVNSYMYLVNVQIFERSNLHDLAHKYALEAVKFNPNYFDSWRLLSVLKNTNDEEKALAFQNMRRLDPKNPELK